MALDGAFLYGSEQFGFLGQIGPVVVLVRQAVDVTGCRVQADKILYRYSVYIRGFACRLKSLNLPPKI